ncbi:MAG: hypothetical protein PHG65_10340 [Kiritimatiellae bacterium]|nr:hypothetical protein [Kiritimatiellia bacterium]
MTRPLPHHPLIQSVNTFCRCLVFVLPTLCTEAALPPDPATRCLEACALIQHITPSEQQSAWNALDAFSNAPNETLELFSPAGASLYIKGEALSFSAAILHNDRESLRLYSQMQNKGSGTGQFFSWNEDGQSIDRTDLAWLQCTERPDAPVVGITITTPYPHDTSNILHGAWAGAFTDTIETDTTEPEKQVGQMNALFIPNGPSFFFRFTDNRKKYHGEGVFLNNRLVGHLAEEEPSAFYYFDATLDPTNRTIRGNALSVENHTLTTRRFFLKKEKLP